MAWVVGAREPREGRRAGELVCTGQVRLLVRLSLILGFGSPRRHLSRVSEAQSQGFRVTGNVWLVHLLWGRRRDAGPCWGAEHVPQLPAVLGSGWALPAEVRPEPSGALGIRQGFLVQSQTKTKPSFFTA